MSRSLPFLLIFLLQCSSFGQPVSAPKREVRAVWLATAAGLDWPRSADKAEQQASLKEIIRKLRAARFNTLIFQVRPRGDAYYHSRFEPWAENLTGTLGEDPGWDPLKFLLAEAHAAGIEVHAWFNVFKIRGPLPVGTSTPLHPSLAHTGWTVQIQNEQWFDPGIPAVRTYTLAVAFDLVQHYDVDGINFDYIRYPNRDFPDEETFRKYGRGMDRDDWRRRNIDAFLSAFYDSAMVVKPMLKVGAAPLGVYDGVSNVLGPITGRKSYGSYYSYYQDSQGWIRRKMVDYLCPQIYWPINHGDDGPDFSFLAKSWQSNSAGRHIYIGIGAYRDDVANEVREEIDLTRLYGSGQVFFRYSSIEGFDMFGDRYNTPANIPPMPWKDPIPPLSPQDLVVTELSSNVFHLEWIPPRAATDGDLPTYYNIYRSATLPMHFDSASLIAITANDANYHVDTVKTPEGVKYYYAVAALDKGNNESVPSPTGTVVVQEAIAISHKMRTATGLSVFSNGEGSTLVAYSLAERSPMSLTLSADNPTGTGNRIASLAEGIQDGGTYVVSLATTPLPEGSYRIRLEAGGAVFERPLRITK